MQNDRRPWFSWFCIVRYGHYVNFAHLPQLLDLGEGTLGLVLAVVGVYGVISYAASQKIHEIGIRIALGAHPADILKMVFRQGLVIVAVGLVIGVAMALAAARVVGTLLTVSATDPATYLAVSTGLTIVVLLASYLPARRAMRIDPIEALRYE